MPATRPRCVATRVPAFAFLNRSLTERLPIAAGGMLGSYPKEVGDGVG